MIIQGLDKTDNSCLLHQTYWVTSENGNRIQSPKRRILNEIHDYEYKYITNKPPLQNYDFIYSLISSSKILYPVVLMEIISTEYCTVL
jgi:hypothetical protein